MSNASTYIGIFLLILGLLWLYKCIGVRKEGRHYNIYSFGRWVRTISGARDKRPDKVTGELKIIPEGEPRNTKRFFFILWPLERRSSFDFAFSTVKNTTQLTAEEKGHVEWGNLSKDNEVVVSRLERTDHHRDQYDYDMIFKDLETGLPQLPAGLDTSKITSPQNVKVRIRIRATVEAVNPQDAENRTGGGTLIWFPSLKAVINTGLGDLVGTGSFSDLIKLRGENLEKKKLTSSDFPSFLEYVNNQMLEIKRIGYRVKSMDFVDYEVMPESAGYIKSLADLAESEVKKERAANDAKSIKLKLEPIIEAAKKIVEQYEESIKNIRSVGDQTIIGASQHMTGLKVLGNFGGPSGGGKEQDSFVLPDIKTVINILTAQIANEEIGK